MNHFTDHPALPDDTDEDDPNAIGKPAVFLICALVVLVLGLSLTMPADIRGQREELAALPAPHLDRAGTLGIIEQSGRVYPVFFPEEHVDVREHARLVLPGTSAAPEIFVGIVSSSTGSATGKGTFRRLEPSSDHTQHPVFALPRRYDGRAVYYDVDMTALF